MGQIKFLMQSKQGHEMLKSAVKCQMVHFRATHGAAPTTQPSAQISVRSMHSAPPIVRLRCACHTQVYFLSQPEMGTVSQVRDLPQSHAVSHLR